MRIGILGGTFDPPHVGHLAIAQDAWARVPLDRVLFVPAALPPHKIGVVCTAPDLRLEMVRAAIAGDDRFEASPLELERSGPSYTVDTLRELTKRQQGTELFLLLGADQFREIGTWRESAEIARLARLVVIPRGDEDAAPMKDARGALPHDARVTRLDATRIDISSTEIRRRRAAGEPIRYLVPDDVLRVIEREHLYEDDRQC
ncbi:MAG TPA: nicotinate-nucleotide adenylyltransferase [Longimicrobiales bacterium]